MTSEFVGGKKKKKKRKKHRLWCPDNQVKEKHFMKVVQPDKTFAQVE